MSAGRLGAAALAVAALTFLAGCTDARGTAGETVIGGGVTTIEASHRTPAPALEGELLEGGRLDLADYRGKVVVLNFWGSWCGPCAHEAPMLKALSDELKSRGVEFIGVDVRDQRANAIGFQRRYGISYPSLFDQPASSVLAFDGKVPANPPNTVVLDKAGRVAVRITGETSESTLRPLIDGVLSEVAP